MKIISLYLIFFLAIHSETNATALKTTCLETLREAAVCKDFWVQVHAIEYLAELGYTEQAEAFVRSELSEYQNVPQKRIGFWRSSYKISQSSKEKSKWINKIKNAYLDGSGNDRVHAAESLSKLGFSLNHFDHTIVADDERNGGMLASFVIWGTTLPIDSRENVAYGKLLEELKSNEESRRKIAAYALGFVGLNPPATVWKTLALQAKEEPPQSAASPYLLGAAYSLHNKEDTADLRLVATIYNKLRGLKDIKDKEARVELCRSLAAKGGKDDIPLLLDLMNDKDPITDLPSLESNLNPEVHPWNLDVKAAAAYAILKITNREST